MQCTSERMETAAWIFAQISRVALAICRKWLQAQLLQLNMFNSIYSWEIAAFTHSAYI